MRNRYLSEDTIGAIASPTGGAISVVRVSGPAAFDTLVHVTQRAESKNSIPRQMTRCQLYSPSTLQRSTDAPVQAALLQKLPQALDDALFVRFVAPKSYTGEDLVEYHLHGGHFIAQTFMEELIRLGIRQALPGEFSFRAVRNGKMSLFQAQAVADLISSSNTHAVSIALEKMSGTQNQFLTDLADGLRQIAVLGEVGIDFADQDIEEVSLSALKKRILIQIRILQNLKASYQRGLRLQDGVKVAFAGLPNAGKSSFFNALLGEDRSIVTEIAGTTRDVIRETLTLRAKTSTLTLRLEDTAGLRTTDNLIEKIGIDRTRSTARQADLVLYLVDPFSPAEAVREQWESLNGYLGDYFSGVSSPNFNSSNSSLADKTIGILTKADLINSEPSVSSLSAEKLRDLGIHSWVPTSAKTGYGIEAAIEKIISFCESWTHRTPGELILTRLDHVSAVEEALTHLERAGNAPEIDLFVADIRQALHSLTPLIGETLPDDLLGKIFSDFCIGK
jgi:tRNA modification GTPase